MNHPFIYFFTEPNVVFVYKIEGQNYISISDFLESDRWETFVLNEENEFDMFDHLEGNPNVGRTFFAKQDDLIVMAEFINKQIQKNRALRTSGSVHIVSSESAAGSLRGGLERPNTVIGIPDFLSIGPLGKLDEKMGQTHRKDWLIENINFEQEAEYPIKFANTLRELEDIPYQVPIHIWYGNNASEQVCMRFLIYLLRDKTNDIFLINSTDLYDKHMSSKDEQQHIFDTSQIEPKDLKLLFEINKTKNPLSEKERIQLEIEWKALAQTKEVLRIWSNGNIIGVPENHFDSIILHIVENLHKQQGNKDFIKIGTVLEELFKQMDEFVGFFFLEYRIRHLIYSGMLEIKGIPKSLWNYSIRKRNELDKKLEVNDE
ncbi:DUF1835 domain-containing protein [Psychrobacillus sp. OK032]|uniref:DUF1835 domain-containing protein n=1 Tax=Psychrobacillus sp. OK032 TaxID=1884358 RepID=UPI0008D5F488|nr:DUF1835 domain-containing protein [Psychrobacillus sp. OK032]SES12592.1 Protein of unknown function [Psychrobacillus sp. OK032]